MLLPTTSWTRPLLHRTGAGAWVAAGFLAAVLAPVQPGRSAEGLPSVDPKDYCTNFAGFAVNETMLRQGCLKREVTAERHVRALWAETPEPVRAECLKALALVKPSYQVLSGCMAQAVGTLWMNGDLRLVPR